MATFCQSSLCLKVTGLHNAWLKVSYNIQAFSLKATADADDCIQYRAVVTLCQPYVCQLLTRYCQYDVCGMFDLVVFVRYLERDLLNLNTSGGTVAEGFVPFWSLLKNRLVGSKLTVALLFTRCFLCRVN